MEEMGRWTNSALGNSQWLDGMVGQKFHKEIKRRNWDSQTRACRGGCVKKAATVSRKKARRRRSAERSGFKVEDCAGMMQEEREDEMF